VIGVVLTSPVIILRAFYDFNKAFDLVNHDFLFEKLSQMGINVIPLNFIKSYLRNRKYFVQLKYIDEYGNSIVYKSREREWNKEVPQGSNLGPGHISLPGYDK
jgi:hypothetical protein